MKLSRRQFLAAVTALPAALRGCAPEPVMPVVAPMNLKPVPVYWEQTVCVARYRSPEYLARLEELVKDPSFLKFGDDPS